MSTKNITLLVIAGLVLILGYTGCNGYNGLIAQDENVNNAWNKVQSDYQRRADLIPNLVNTVKGEANFEQGTHILDTYQERIAAIPGNSLPSKYSSSAPPPVDT